MIQCYCRYCQPRAWSRNFIDREARWRSIGCPEIPIFFFQTNKLRPSPSQTNIVRLKQNAYKWQRPLRGQDTTSYTTFLQTEPQIPTAFFTFFYQKTELSSVFLAADGLDDINFTLACPFFFFLFLKNAIECILLASQSRLSTFLLSRLYEEFPIEKDGESNLTQLYTQVRKLMMIIWAHATRACLLAVSCPSITMRVD